MPITITTSAPQSISVVTPPTATASMTWRAMSGSGATTGTIVVTTLIHHPLTLQVQRVARTAWFAGVVGAVRRPTCVVPIAPTTSRRTAPPTSVFEWLQFNN